jgi:CubicO group peptidase (beta-lactamase class C family)
MYATAGSLYTIESDGSLYRVSPDDGTWAQVGAPGTWKATIAGTIYHGELYTAADNGGLYRTDLSTGERAQIGDADFASTVQMFATGDSLYTIETDGTLYRVNPEDGTWGQVGPKGAWAPTITGTIIDGTLYTAESGGGLYRTNLGDGTWQQLGQAAFGSTRLMFAKGPDVYTIETDGTLYRVVVNPQASLDAFIASIGITAQTPGVAIRVIDSGNIVFDKCYGLADVEDKRPITPQTTFELASCSKQFAGVAILKLYEQHKVSIDDDVRKYLPELPVYDAKNPIRIRNLEQHTSGLPEYMSFPAIQGKDPRFANDADYVIQFAALREQFPLQFPTGEKFQYCNTNYMLLVLIVERVTKKSYGTFLKQEVFGPLGMTTATVYETPDVRPHDPAIGYSNENGAFQPIWGAPPYRNETLLTVGDGGVWVSLDDLLRWDQAWQQGKVLKESTIRTAFVPTKTRDGNDNTYLFGWAMTFDKGKLVDMGHGGAWGGFRTSIDRNLVTRPTVLILSNGSFDLGGVFSAVK